jgi:adenylate cyclase class 2
MKEIEILVKVLESKKDALKKLSRFRKDHVAKIVDKYYYHPSRKGMRPSGAKSSTEMLRIRKKDGKTLVTYKKDVFAGKKWLYGDEYETTIGDAEIVSEIFEKLGFKPLVVVNNSRTIYYHNDFEICLEDVKNLGLFLEIEYVGKNSKNPTAIQKKIFDLIDATGINVSKEVNQGKAEMLYRKENSKR